jgi:hypothetical protein
MAGSIISANPRSNYVVSLSSSKRPVVENAVRVIAPIQDAYQSAALASLRT